MDENQVRKIVLDELNSSQYNIKGVPFHTHNGIDSPFLPSWIIAGVGLPKIFAPKGTIYVNTTAPSSGTSRIFISTSGTTATWAYFTASA